jgi:hypothetical protein
MDAFLALALIGSSESAQDGTQIESSPEKSGGHNSQRQRSGSDQEPKYRLVRLSGCQGTEEHEGPGKTEGAHVFAHPVEPLGRPGFLPRIQMDIAQPKKIEGLLWASGSLIALVLAGAALNLALARSLPTRFRLEYLGQLLLRAVGFHDQTAIWKMHD